MITGFLRRAAGTHGRSQALADGAGNAEDSIMLFRLIGRSDVMRRLVGFIVAALGLFSGGVTVAGGEGVCNTSPVDWGVYMPHHSRTSLNLILESARDNLRLDVSEIDGLEVASSRLFSAMPLEMVSRIQVTAQIAKRGSETVESDGPLRRAQIFASRFWMSLASEGFIDCVPANLEDEDPQLVVTGFVEAYLGEAAWQWGLRSSRENKLKAAMGEIGLRDVGGAMRLLFLFAVADDSGVGADLEDWILCCGADPPFGATPEY